MGTHRKLYPEQYTHELVGKHVAVTVKGKVHVEGVVERVVSTRFGLLAIITGEDPLKAWAVKDCSPT